MIISADSTTVMLQELKVNGQRRPFDFHNPEEVLQSCFLVSALNSKPRFHFNSHPNAQASERRKQDENSATESVALLSWTRQGKETKMQAASTAVFTAGPPSLSFLLPETQCCRQLDLSASTQDGEVAPLFV